MVDVRCRRMIGENHEGGVLNHRTVSRIRNVVDHVDPLEGRRVVHRDVVVEGHCTESVDRHDVVVER